MAKGTGTIVLDGPSAVAFYRDRDDLVANREQNLEPDEPDIRIDSSSEDFWLSDEDIAAMLAGESVFGSLTVAEDEESLVASTVAGMPNLARSSMRRMRGTIVRSRDLKLVPYDTLGIRPPAEDSRLYLLVPEAQVRRTVRHVKHRLCRTELPDHAFLRLGSHAYVPTPEFTFLLMAHYLDLHELIVLGMELCGHYRLVGSSTNSPLVSNRTLYGQRPLTTPQRIAALLERADGFTGLPKAKRACAYLTAGSASPMETALYLLLCLPRKLGGYGLPRPTLNAKRKVTSLAGSFTLSRTLVPDLFWSFAMLDVEYDSEEFHASAEALRKGARRALALRSMGVQVMSVTKDVVYDEDAFDAIARLVAKVLGVRIRKLTQAAKHQRQLLRKVALYGFALGTDG